MTRAAGRRYDLRWSRRHVAGLLAVCALAAAALGVRAAGRTVRFGAVLPIARARAAAAAEKVNPNTASVASLRRLPDIGPVKAQAIVDWRRAHGPAPFRTPEDLTDVPGIGPGTVGGIRRHLALPGAGD